jgi:hypothetical protein
MSWGYDVPGAFLIISLCDLVRSATFETVKQQPMFFDQVIGSGANIFLLIIAILFGFVNALAFVDARRVKKEQEERGENH